jgi:hypothetical protein
LVALSTPLYPLFGESKRNPLKNREGGGALALGGRRLMMQRNNLPKVGGSSRWYVIAERVGGGSARGYTVQSFGAANWATKNKWKWNTTRPYMATNQWIFTQQPTENRQPRRRGLRRGGVTSGRRGGARYHCFLEGGSRIRSKNLNKIVEFSK